MKPVMQCKTYKPTRMMYPCLGEIKYDGIFARWDHHHCSFYTRAGNMINGLSHLQHKLKNYKDDFDGELVIPSMEFFEMNGLLRRHDEKPTCIYYIFDSPTLRGTHQDRIDQINYLFFPKLNYHTKAVKAEVLYNPKDVDNFYTRALSEGCEGVVYKYAKGHYHGGKQYDVHKRTPLKTTECRIIGFEEGKKSFTGMLGAFYVNFKGVKVKVGGGPGVTHTFRLNVWQHQEKFLSQMMKVGYKGITEKGSLRSPKYLGIRWDI